MILYFRTHVTQFWLLAVTVLVLVLVFATYVRPAAPIIDPIVDAVGFSPNESEVALKLCLKPETVITLVNSPQDRYYQALWEEPGLRYDLTWRADGTAVAVEKTRGRDFDVWAEQIDTPFLTCVSSRSPCPPEPQLPTTSTCIRVKEAVH